MRNSACAQLTAEIPPALLGELIGVNANTATRWAALTAGNRTAYAADLGSGRDLTTELQREEQRGRNPTHPSSVEQLRKQMPTPASSSRSTNMNTPASSASSRCWSSKD